MKKAYYIPFAILLLLIITNPSQKAFKEYLGTNSYSGLQRTNNFFVCDIFKNEDIKYVGFLGNFFRLDKPKSEQSGVYHGKEMSRAQIDSAEMADSIAMADSSKMKMADTTTLPPPPKKVDEYGIPIKKNKDPLGLDEIMDTIGYTKDGLPILKKAKDPLHILSK